MFPFDLKRGIKTEILSKILILMCLSIAIIVAYSYIKSKEANIETAEGFAQKLNSSSISQTSNYLRTASTIIKNAAMLLKDQDIVADVNAPIMRYMLDVLRTTDQIATLTFTSEKGVLIAATDLSGFSKNLLKSEMVTEGDGYPLQTMEEDHKEKNDTYYFDRNGRYMSNRAIAENIPNFRKLSWYKAAANTTKIVWSDIHLLPSNNLPGISCSMPIYSADNNLKGVISADLTTNDISSILNEMRINDGTRTFIVNLEGQIIADSDMSQNIPLINTQPDEATATTILKASATNEDTNLSKAIEYYKNTTKINGSVLNLSFNIKNEKGEDHIVIATRFPEAFKLNWKIFSFTPIADLTDKLVSIQTNLFYISIFILLIVITFIYFQTQSLSEPIVELTQEASKIRKLELDEGIYLKSNIVELQELSNSMKDLKSNFTMFAKYIPKGLVEKLVHSGQKATLGGSLNNITIMFSDVESFSTVSENMLPEQLMLHLSDYFEELTKVIMDNNGSIDKFIGDAIMAFWGAPEVDHNQPYNSCRAALLCQQKLRIMNKYWQSVNKPMLKTRIGIHKGSAVVGNVGSSERMNYTAIGDSVNLASRLEGINKMYGTYIIISQTVKDTLPEGFITRPVDIVTVKGKTQGIKAYELVGLNGDPRIQAIPPEHQVFYTTFTKAFDLYISRQWKESKELLQNLKADNDTIYKINDRLIDMYIGRCDTFLTAPPPDNWNGVTHLQEK
ncbi:MAG: adenylate/guanylate cyclase domain-containing protein [Alphaproteobacteria bacterium]